jgi:hypothetical protein
MAASVATNMVTLVAAMAISAVREIMTASEQRSGQRESSAGR